MMRIACGVIFLLSVLSVGCQPGRPRAGYGDSVGPEATESLNGLSVFRSAIEARGYKTAKFRGLVNRAAKIDTMIWAPSDFDTPSQFAIDWFDDWLSQSSSRVLLYIGRDFDGTTRYWQQLAEEANGEERWIFREEEAFARSAHDHLRRNLEFPSKCDWFVIDKSKRQGEVDRFEGEWSTSLSGESTWESNTGPTPRAAYTEVEIEAIESRAEIDDDWDAFGSTAPQKITAREISPDDPTADPLADPMVDGNAPLTSRVLLTSADGDPLVFALECKRWNQGRIIVVRNGSALLNYGAVHSGNVAFLQKLLTEILPAGKKGRVGFLVSDHSPSIFASDEDPTKLLGFEMLTVWPLNLITMLSLAIGILAMMAMLPIFGRPLHSPQRPTEDFGAHIEALGMLLQRSQDRVYALHCIIDYFRRVRKEPNSTWGQLTDEYTPPPMATTQVVSPLQPPVLDNVVETKPDSAKEPPESASP